MSWASAEVARLSLGESERVDGLLLLCGWPMHAHVRSQFDDFRKLLLAILPDEAYVYPSSTLHCTIATLRAFGGGKLEGQALEETLKRWTAVLDEARDMVEWPRGSFRLKMNTPTLEGKAAIFRYDDVDGAIEKMRGCLRKAIRSHGGIANEGSSTTKGKALTGSAAGEPAPHIPDIVHSTIVRWKEEVKDKAAVQLAFNVTSLVCQCLHTWTYILIICLCRKLRSIGSQSRFQCARRKRCTRRHLLCISGAILAVATPACIPECLYLTAPTAFHSDLTH